MHARITHFIGISKLPPSVAIPEPIFQFYSCTSYTKKGISLLYSTLNDDWPCSQLATLNNWEEELSTPITQAMWQQAFRLAFEAYRCSNHWESYQRNIHRWYLTPYRLSKMYSGHSPDCRRNCGSVGSMAHILWFCGSLSSFWKQIFILISSISGIPLTPTPSLPCVM